MAEGDKVSESEISKPSGIREARIYRVLTCKSGLRSALHLY